MVQVNSITLKVSVNAYTITCLLIDIIIENIETQQGSYLEKLWEKFLTFY